jgi:hypothetical protein
MLRLLDGPIWEISVEDFVIAMERARRTKSPVPLRGMAFKVEGKTSSEIVRWVESMDGTDIRKDN